MKKPSRLRRIFGGLWRALTVLRLALANLLFLALLVVGYFALTGGPPREVPERAALLLAPAGRIVDERTRVEPLALLGDSSPASQEVRLRDLIEAVDLAAEDPAISALVLQPDQLVSTGLSRILELAPALARFRASGKPVIAVGDYYTQGQYLLAVQADTVLLHPQGTVGLEGFSSYVNYFREALDKLAVNVHVFRAGDFKSVAEPLTRMDMSEGEKAITRAWLEDFWGQYTELVEERRSLPAGAVTAHINEYPQRLAAQGGDTASLALADGLVDRLLSRSESNDYLVEVVGAADAKGRFEAVPFDRYLARQSSGPKLEGRQRVAIVTAQGAIMPGDQDPGAIGADTLARQFRRLGEEQDIAAVVLRINSGGGSVFASEVVRAALDELRRESALPVVVSMGPVAASGAYYIATAADEIWATPATLTGSIGVFAAFPTLENLLDRAGIATDGVGTTALAGGLRLDRPLDPAVAESLRHSVRYQYERFLKLVRESRGLTREQVDAVAEGRVWSAPAARDVGLVDELGSLTDAVRAAAGLAGLGEEEYRADHVRPQLSPRQLLLQTLADRMGLDGVAPGSELAAAARLLQPLQKAGTTLQALRDPRHLYMLCLECGGR
jgi:protease-4